MSQTSPWARVRLPLLVLIVIVIVGAVAWPYLYSPTKVLAACTITAGKTGATGSIAPVILTATPSFTVGSVTERPKVVVALNGLSTSLNQTISAGFKVILNKPVSSVSAGAGAITVYQSDLQVLQHNDANTSFSTIFNWTIPSVPGGTYKIEPVLSSAATKLLGDSLQVVPQALTIQSPVRDFNWVDTSTVRLTNSTNKLVATAVNASAKASTVHIAARLFEGVDTDTAQLKNTVTGDISYAAADLNKGISLTIPGLSDLASGAVLMTVNFGNYTQYLQARFEKESAAGFAANSISVRRAFLGHISKVTACVNIPDLAITKGTVAVRWYHGSQQVATATADISTKVGQIAVESTKFTYTNAPDRAEVDLLTDGHILDTLKVNSVL